MSVRLIDEPGGTSPDCGLTVKILKLVWSHSNLPTAFPELLSFKVSFWTISWLSSKNCILALFRDSSSFTNWISATT